VTATADDDGEIMAVEHVTYPVIGVQFHPESAASEYGYAMLDRFLQGRHSRGMALPVRADGASEAPRTSWWRRGIGQPGGDFVPPPVELVR
jgi:hypothetical protein